MGIRDATGTVEWHDDGAVEVEDTCGGGGGDGEEEDGWDRGNLYRVAVGELEVEDGHGMAKPQRGNMEVRAVVGGAAEGYCRQKTLLRHVAQYL